MKVFFSGRSIGRMALAWTLVGIIGIMPLCQAQTPPTLDKHARKIHKRLAKYKPGSYIHLVLRDDTQRSGSLGPLAGTSFTVTSSDNNTPETHSYSDVAKVERGKQYIGQGSEPAVYIAHPVRLAVIGVLVAGAAVTAVKVR